MTALVPLHLHNQAFAARAVAAAADGAISAADAHVVDLLAEQFGERDPAVLLALSQAVRAPRLGHVGFSVRGDDEILQRLVASPLIGAVGELAERTIVRPFVLQSLRSGRALLMSRRQWVAQRQLRDGLLALSARTGCKPSDDAVNDDAVNDDPVDQVLRTLQRGRLSVIIGGPGTGKTYAVRRLLAALLRQHDDTGPALRFALAAPTGKAAVRLAEALREDPAGAALDGRERAAIERLQPTTLHRLLGISPARHGRPLYGKHRPLAADVVVVDEVSMVDLAMMAALVEALGPTSRLVLLGDPQQLASVEAGTVLADIVTGSRHVPDLAAATVHFRRNHRFRDAPQLTKILTAIRGGSEAELARAMADMRSGRGEIEHHAALSIERLARGYEPFAAAITQRARAGTLATAQAHVDVLAALRGFRILTAHRRGAVGAESLNAELSALLQRRWAAAVNVPDELQQWPGRPIMVTRNSPDVGLMNGDVGVILPLGERLVAAFDARQNPHDAPNGGVRWVELPRLPPHETCFAMTVHKSQGSQFPHVAFVLPERPSRIWTRELIYTALSRAQHSLAWFGSADVLLRGLATNVERASGLADLLAAP